MNRLESITKPVIWFMALLLAALTAGCGGGDGGRDPILGSPSLTPGLISITVTPATASIPIGAPQQFIATATYSDGASSDVTASSTWTSGATSVATINGTSGLAVGIAIGASAIIADFGGISGSATLTVTPATLVSIAVTPATASVPIGLKKPLLATGTYSDGTTFDITKIVAWTSGATPIATVLPSTGVSTAVSAGAATISASLSGKSGSAILTVTSVALVSIAVTPATNSVPIGLTKPLLATGTYSDGTTIDITDTVLWTSGNTTVATVLSTTGAATAVSAGSATITASLSGKSGSASLTVTSVALVSIAVTPATNSVPIGLTKPLLATGTYSDGTTLDITDTVLWTSGNTTVATVQSTAGVATAVSAGSATISASLSGKSGSAALTVPAATLSSIMVTPATSTVAIGITQPLVALGTYSDGSTLDITDTVVWTSGNTPVATVLSSTGVATAVSAGSATISASLSGKSGSATLTVPAATLTLSSIMVTPATATVAIGLTKPFAAIGTYSDGTAIDITNAVVWVSGNTAVATVLSTTGVATAVSAGSATISASLSGKSGSATLTVPASTLSSIAVTPATATVAVGLTQPLVAWGTYSDGSTLNITNTVAWTSGNTAVATVLSTTGVATAVSAGSVTISASLSGKSGSATLTVPAATLSSIAVTPATATVAIGLTKSLLATGTYSDGSTLNITNTVLWTSGNTPVATVLSTTGVATAVSAGSATITASLSGKSGSATLTVPVIIALPLNPTAPNLGEAGRYVILASQAVTTTVGSVISNGDIGNMDQARATYITGFTPSGPGGDFVELTGGSSYAADDLCPAPYTCPLHYSTPVVGAAWTDAATMITQVRTDLGNADTFLAANPNPGAPTQVAPIELGNLVLTRGVYRNAANIGITTGPLHLDAQGDPNSIFIIVTDGTLTTGASGSIVLDNGALARNVYWRSAGITTIAAGTTFYGNVFANTQVNVLSGANITGRLFGVTGQVTLISDVVTKAQ